MGRFAPKKDGESKHQFFTHQKQGSNWSQANRERAEKWIAENRMTESSLNLINLAKKPATGQEVNYSWPSSFSDWPVDPGLKCDMVINWM